MTTLHAVRRRLLPLAVLLLAAPLTFLGLTLQNKTAYLTFIVIAEVAPSIRLDGTKASVTQRTRRPALMRSAGASWPVARVSATGRRERHIMSADPLSNTASSP